MRSIGALCGFSYAGDDQPVKTPLQRRHEKRENEEERSGHPHAEFIPIEGSSRTEQTRPNSEDATLFWAPDQELPSPQEGGTGKRQKIQGLHSVDAEDFFPRGNLQRQNYCAVCTFTNLLILLLHI